MMSFMGRPLTSLPRLSLHLLQQHDANPPIRRVECHTRVAVTCALSRARRPFSPGSPWPPAPARGRGRCRDSPSPDVRHFVPVREWPLENNNIENYLIKATCQISITNNRKVQKRVTYYLNGPLPPKLRHPDRS